MKILLDENMPHLLVAALRAAGHDAESVKTLGKTGAANGELRHSALHSFDLFLTKDAEFAGNARLSPAPYRCKTLRVSIPQKPQKQFVDDFMAAFQKSDWTRYQTGDDWP